MDIFMIEEMQSEDFQLHKINEIVLIIKCYNN